MKKELTFLNGLIEIIILKYVIYENLQVNERGIKVT